MMAILLIATAVVLIGGLAVIPAAFEEAQGQTHSEACQKEQGPGNPGCTNSFFFNPSNPNSPCDTGRELGANHTGSNC